LPGQAGNAVLAGRRGTFGRPFHRLDALRPGDPIEVTTGQGNARYLVSRVGTVSANHTDPISPTHANQLTLITSAPEYRATKELVAIATLQGQPFQTLGQRVNQVRNNELALQGDTTVLPLIVWAELALVAILVAVFLRRRWPRLPALLVAVPLLTLLALLVFDSFTPLLPSTL
jgi:sortase A